MDDQQAGLWQMIMGLIGRKKQEPPPPPPQQTQGMSTRDTLAAPNRQAYLEYAVNQQSLGEPALPYAQWAMQQRKQSAPQ